MSRPVTCWKSLLEDAMHYSGESLDDIVSSTMSNDDMLEQFDAGYGSTNGKPFTVWTENTVYFPVCYDGSEWVGGVSRNPDGKATEHQGGR